ncbi:MAG: hypothetical protein ACW98F_01190 [Candidatus Hodarchaeales archaeon]|jgi:hypothetical protein
MTTKDIVITCVWTTDGFVLLDKKNEPTSDEAVLRIDEGAETISVSIPSELSLISKKIIERRVQSIAKSGFSLPSSSLRIGGGFKVEINKTDEIPTVLLQEGHKYTFGEGYPGGKESIKQEIRPKLPSQFEDDYVPSFLIHDEAAPQQPQISQIVKEMEKPGEPTTTTEKGFSEVKQTVVSDLPVENIAGSFVIALSDYGDIYLTRQKNTFTVEYSKGRVDFEVHNGEISILSTDRVVKDDESIRLALEKSRNR